MPSRLRRIYGLRDFHFITCSCYRRQPLLGTRHARDVFLRIFEQVRRKYKFEVVGYVVMPEHFHILIAEPETGNPSTVLQVLKQSVAHRLLKPPERDAAISRCFGETMVPASSAISGSLASMISMSTPTRKERRSSATCTKIR